MTIKQIGIDICKLVRRWWWKDENDAMFLQLSYGNRPIVIAGKKTAPLKWALFPHRVWNADRVYDRSRAT